MPSCFARAFPGLPIFQGSAVKPLSPSSRCARFQGARWNSLPAFITGITGPRAKAPSPSAFAPKALVPVRLAPSLRVRLRMTASVHPSLFVSYDGSPASQQPRMAANRGPRQAALAGVRSGVCLDGKSRDLINNFSTLSNKVVEKLPCTQPRRPLQQRKLLMGQGLCSLPIISNLARLSGHPLRNPAS